MQQDNLEAVLNHLGVAVIVVDSRQRILSDNQLARRQFARRLVGRPLPEVIDSSKLARKIARVLDGTRHLSTEIRVRQDTKQTYRVNVVRLEPSSGHDAPRAVVSLENITHIRATNRMRSDFVANVSHELRSPLTTLYGFIETLRANPDIAGADRDRFLGLMENEARRMVRLIDELLTLSILQAETDPEPSDMIAIVPLIERVIAALAPLARAEATRVVLGACGPSGASGADEEPLLVRGKDDKLTQVFRNLIENAIKYSRRDSEVRVLVRPDPLEPEMLNVLVQDSGEGIAPKHIARLTERFYRVDKGRSRSMGGTGLGLAIVKHILAQHRGELRIESTVGVGSTFMVSLPRA